jgi:Flp pilus assembly protein TadD
LALADLRAEDAAGYRRACNEIAEQLPPVGPKLVVADAYLAAKALSIGPNAAEDWTKPLAWIDHALSRLQAFEKANPDKKDALRREKNDFLGTRGAVLFRAGRFEEAAKALHEAVTVQPNGGAYSVWVFLSLVEQRLGHAGPAKEAAAKARAIQSGSTPESVWDKAMIESLAAELDAVVLRPGK